MRYSIPPDEDNELSHPSNFQTSKEKHERYCEQRMVMFRPYRRRADLKRLRGVEHPTFASAFSLWNTNIPDPENPCDSAPESVRHEVYITEHRAELIAECTDDPDLEVPSEDEVPNGEKDDDLNLNDPLVAMFGMSKPPPQWNPDVHLNHQQTDWTASRFDLAHLTADGSTGWLVSQKEELGDDALQAGILDYSKYDFHKLDHHQRFAYELITRHAESVLIALRDNKTLPPPLRMLIDGYGGTGKSFLLHCVGRFIREKAQQYEIADPLRVAALSGAAATQVYGCTLHSLWGIPVGVPFDEIMVREKEDTLGTKLKDVAFFFVDERSMLSLTMLGQIISRARKVYTEYATEELCERSFVLFGDDKQLPPPQGGKLYSNPREASKMSNGKKQQSVNPTNYQNEASVAYKHFTTVVKLQVNQRATGGSPSQQLFRRFLLKCLRDCLPTKEWYAYWKRTNSLASFSREKQERFLNGFRVCSTNAAIDAHNTEMLCRMNAPLALIMADHPKGGKFAAQATNKSSGNLPLKVTLCRGAWVVYLVNTWTSRGVVHGLLCRVLEIVYAKGTKPHNSDGPGVPALPIVVFVEATAYLGPSYEHLDLPENERRRLGYTGIFPVQPVSRKFIVYHGKGPRKTPVHCERIMIPLALAWARSIHKFQGMTVGEGESIDVMLLDIGDTELAAGLSYVGGSRAKTPGAYCVHPFPSEERFMRIGALNSKSKEDHRQKLELQRREAECWRLQRLASDTIDSHHDLYDWCATQCAQDVIDAEGDGDGELGQDTRSNGSDVDMGGSDLDMEGDDMDADFFDMGGSDVDMGGSDLGNDTRGDFEQGLNPGKFCADYTFANSLLTEYMTAEDGCDCSVLTPWAWCRACGGEESGIELIRCQTCGLVRCSSNCGFVIRNTPETPTEELWEQTDNECHECPIPEGAWKEYPRAAPALQEWLAARTPNMKRKL